MTRHLQQRFRQSSCAKSDSRSRVRSRRALFETLETRTVLTALPFGAMADDTGEYLLGEVRVNVVLLESNSAILPHDNGTINYSGQPLINYTPENWTPAAISTVKANVQAGIEWWKQALDALPDVRDGLLNFSFDWTRADNPVQTGFEPIARRSDDFSQWIYDFLGPAGFANSAPNFSSDIRAFNNFQRQQTNADWAFTVFVVNDANDPDGRFAPGGSFSQAFAFSGGRFMVVPASRPVSTIAHEAGHMFWGLDEYAGGSTHTASRGYYNTQNANAEDNPAPGFVQAPSIMAIDRPSSDPQVPSTFARSDAFASFTLSQSSREMIGWRDSDADGIFDVLDVPFTLTGTGRYDASTGQYRFTGASSVETMLNQNPSGLQNDITINRIRVLEYQVDNEPWTVYQTFPDRTYKTNLQLEVPIPAGEHTIRIRTHDTRTGAMSPEFVATTSGSQSAPQSVPQPGVSGFVFFDSDGDGAWGGIEAPLVDWAVELVDEFGGPIVLQRKIEPSEYVEGTALNTVHSQATLTAIGSDVASGVVTAKNSSIFSPAGKVFAATSALLGGSPVETWTTTSRQLRVDFSNAIASVSLRAISSGPASVGRLEAYDAAGNLLDRYTTGVLTSGKHELMTISRATPDVAYVIAHGHASTNVVLDTLTWGASSAATTNIVGAWGLTHLDPGMYRVKVTPPGGHVVTTPASGIYTVTVGPGQAMGNLNFGLRLNNNIWHNLAFGANVTGDTAGLVNLLDVMAVVNWITAHGGIPQLPVAGNPLVSGYVDVDNNGLCNILDLMAVVNHITAQYASGGGAGEGQPAGSGGSTGGGSAGEGQGGGQGEGEENSAPATAAEYYAREAVHFLEIAGADLPCGCSQCLGSTHIEDAPAPRSVGSQQATWAAFAEAAASSMSQLDEAEVMNFAEARLDDAIELVAADVALSIRRLVRD